MRYTSTAFMYYGQRMRGNWDAEISKTRARNPTKTDHRRYRSTFGCGPKVTARLWEMAADSISGDVSPQKFLFGLAELMVYESEENMCPLIGHMGEKPPDEQTFRDWSWRVIDAISNLHDEVILWENRKTDDVGNRCLVSVDGADFMMPEWSPYWEGRKSHKFDRSSLRYEIAICIRNGWIVWTNGGYPAGHWHDLTIYRQWLKWELDDGEYVEADLGYRGEPTCMTPADRNRPEEAKALASRVRKRHETVNKRFKHFGCMKKVFRHDNDKHTQCFRAIAVIVQLSIEMGEPLFAIDNYDTTNLVVE